MKIPKRLKVFPVEISTKDAQRLSPHLSGWNHLQEMFLLGINEPDLQRLVILELCGKKRRNMINRLVGRINEIRRRQMDDTINKALC